ncbi:DNA-binding domain-containing protein [Roseobacter sp. YSTF-M11]|uniref:DNA-binding domain-containing protein n=1 Tax=Roseobacter insulae TaxID=2859783 RepID=A0A9X1FYX7_9RHOB|nr:DNA-binding domain-containing protein [Roseobacter insulae]MBW4710289.1 DNA-binding domain-containing protein [Roseobacter insulae]
MNPVQRRFREALLDAERAVPPDLQDGAGAPAGRRFSVYRNNVVVSLTQALHDAFPLTRKLIGAQSFDALAAHFVRKHPPTSPLMMYYGDALPEFLGSFEPLTHIGYLPDCARLDIAMRRSYHAADTPAVDPSAFQCAPETLIALRLALTPAAIILRSAWPVFDIWRMNSAEGGAKPRVMAQDVLIARPDFDPAPYLLPPGAADWLEALDAGRSFRDAHDHALQTTPKFDLAQALTIALQSGALTDSKTKDR